MARFEKWTGYEFASSFEFMESEAIYSGYLEDIETDAQTGAPIYLVTVRDIRGNDIETRAYNYKDFKRNFYDATALPTERAERKQFVRISFKNGACYDDFERAIKRTYSSRRYYEASRHDGGIYVVYLKLTGAERDALYNNPYFMPHFRSFRWADSKRELVAEANEYYYKFNAVL